MLAKRALRPAPPSGSKPSALPGRALRPRRPLHVVAVAAGPLLLGAPARAGPSIWEVGKPQGHVDIIDDLPSAEEFFHQYMIGTGEYKGVGKPVLLKGAAQRMPAYQLWGDDEHFRTKHAKVKLDQVETEKKETRTKLPVENWTVEKFLKAYTTKPLYSVATTPKGINEEVLLLPVMNCGGYHAQMKATVMWFSSGSTKSVIHADGQENIHCLFAGEKHWAMWHPDSGVDTREMGWINVDKEEKGDPRFKDAYGQFGGNIDVDNVDTEKFSGWKTIRWWNMTMRRGDCAFVPRGWFHYVEAPPERTISVHVWFLKPKKFKRDSCEALEEKGYDLSDFIFRVGDCNFDEDGKRTRCKLPTPGTKLAQASPSVTEGEGSAGAPKAEEL